MATQCQYFASVYLDKVEGAIAIPRVQSLENLVIANCGMEVRMLCPMHTSYHQG